jgi:hypothetical protein
MDTDRTWTAGEAATITGVNTASQLDWRRRGFLVASGEGKWTRFTIRDLCQLRLTRAFIDVGLPVGTAVANIAEAAKVDDFLDPMQSTFLDAVDQHDNGQVIAVIATWPNGARRWFVAFNWDQVRIGLHSDVGGGKMEPVFAGVIMINMTQFAREMVSKIKLMDEFQATVERTAKVLGDMKVFGEIKLG